MKKYLHLFALASFILILVLTIRGTKESLQSNSEIKSNLGGPFEASNSTSRYALTKSIGDNKTFFLTESLARFSSPDVVLYKNKFISIFTPGVSIVSLPFYIVGKLLGYPQLITYFSTLLFAMINMILIIRLSKHFGANNAFSVLSGVIFSLASNALPYAQTLTQHHLSTFLILASIINAFSRRSVINNIVLGILYGAGILMDIPNAFMMLPVIFYVIYKHFELIKFERIFVVNTNIKVFLIGIGFLPMLILFMIYNYLTTSSFTLLGQSIGRTDAFSTKNIEDTKPIPEKINKLINVPFNTRKQLNSTYVLLLSNERAWFFYSPVVLLGIIGIISLYRRGRLKKEIVLLISIIMINIFIYSLFGDPWGGWAFGPRYLIPSTALLCIVIGTFLTKYRRNILLCAFFLLLMTYSIWVNTLGSLTTTLIPPKVEAVNLASPIPYTYAYNQILLKSGYNSSLIYNLAFKQTLTSDQYLLLVVSISVFVSVFLYYYGSFKYND